MNDQVAMTTGTPPSGPTLMRAVRHKDDDWTDEIRVRIVERWKESELSGAEWRFSYIVEYLRKGHVIKRESFSRLGWAVNSMPSGVPTSPSGASNDLMAEVGGTAGLMVDFCVQPGCDGRPTVWYQLKRRFCREGHPSTPDTPEIRGFCARHKRRGDCGLDDSDANYELLSGRPEGAF